MEETIVKALILVSFVFGGYMMKQLGAFSPRSFDTISSIVFRLTLPAAIMVNLNGVHFEVNYLFISVLAILFNFIFIGMGYLLGRDKREKSFYMLNLNGFNIGNFALPFVSYFFDSAAVLVVCIFDAGNSIMCLGIAYALASLVQGERQDGKHICMMLFKTLLTSLPVLSYLLMILLAVAGWKLPDGFIEWAKIPAASNTFLSMLMIGVAVGISLKEEFIRLITRNIIVRLLGSAGIAAGVYFLVPYPMEIKRVIIILLFSPIASMACYFTARLKGNIRVSACISSLYILISVVVMSGLIIILSRVS